MVVFPWMLDVPRTVDQENVSPNSKLIMKISSDMLFHLPLAPVLSNYAFIFHTETVRIFCQCSTDTQNTNATHAVIIPIIASDKGDLNHVGDLMFT